MQIVITMAGLGSRFKKWYNNSIKNNKYQSINKQEGENMTELKERALKGAGDYTIDKVKEEDGNIYYDVYDFDDNLQNTFRTLKEARNWALMMSK